MGKMRDSPSSKRTMNPVTFTGRAASISPQPGVQHSMETPVTFSTLM